MHRRRTMSRTTERRRTTKIGLMEKNNNKEDINYKRMMSGKRTRR